MSPSRSALAAAAFLAALWWSPLVAAPPRATAPAFPDEAALRGASRQLEARLGGAPVLLEMVIYPGRIRFQAQDPKKPENVDQFDWNGGKLGPGSPVKLYGGGKLKDNVFPLASVDLAAIPKLVAIAAQRVNVEGAEATHVTVKRNLPFTKAVRVNVFVNGTRKNGYVEADASGAVLKVHK